MLLKPHRLKSQTGKSNLWPFCFFPFWPAAIIGDFKQELVKRVLTKKKAKDLILKASYF